MSAIPCASVALKTMADGTLRISFDVEPMHAQDAFRLFAAPGTPAALAALQVGYAAAQDVPETDFGKIEKPKGGALAKLAGMWCGDPEFQDWLNKTYVHGEPLRGADGAAQCLRSICEIDSRAELDNNAFAADKFHTFIRGPYSKHLIARGVVQ